MLSEQGLAISLLIVILFGLYNLSKFGIIKFIKVFEKNYELERLERKREIDANIKGTATLVDEVKKVYVTNQLHSVEHTEIKKIMNEKSQEDDKIHNKLIEIMEALYNKIMKS